MQYNRTPVSKATKNDPKYPIKFRGTAMIPRLNQYAPLNTELSMRQLDEILESLYRRPLFLEVKYVDQCGREWDLNYSNYKKILSNVKPIGADGMTVKDAMVAGAQKFVDKVGNLPPITTEDIFPPKNPQPAPEPPKAVTPDPVPESNVTAVPGVAVNPEVTVTNPVAINPEVTVSPANVNTSMIFEGAGVDPDDLPDADDLEEDGDEDDTAEDNGDPAQANNPNYTGKKKKRRHH